MPQQETKDGPPTYWPLSQPHRWTGRFAPVDCAAVVCIPFNATRFSPHAKCPREHTRGVILEQSLLYLYLQACLSVRPEVVMLSTGFPDEVIAELIDDQDADLPTRPLDQVFVIPLTGEQLSNVMAFISDRVNPRQAAEGTGQRQPAAGSRGPEPNIVSGQADWRRICTQTMLVRATELLVGRPIDSVDRLIMSPTVDVTPKDIATDPSYLGHILNVCDPEKVLPKHGGRVRTVDGTMEKFQNNPLNYYEELGETYRFDPIPDLDELKPRFLGPADQVKIFEDPKLGIDANILGRMVWSYRSAPHRKIKAQLKAMYDSLKREIPWSDLEEYHPRSLVVNGLTQRERERGDTLTKFGIISTEPPIDSLLVDPQANLPIIEANDSSMPPGESTNAMIIRTVYPEQWHFMCSMQPGLKTVEAIVDPDDRGNKMLELYKQGMNSGIGMILEDPDALPLALSELLAEREPIKEQLMRMRTTNEYLFKRVMAIYTWKIADGPLQGFDTGGTILAQLVHVFHTMIGLMSNQVPAMLLILLQVWSSPTQNTNQKSCIAMTGTAVSALAPVARFFYGREP